MGGARVQQPCAVPVAQQAEVGTDRRQVIKRRRRHGVVKTAGADAAPERVRLKFVDLKDGFPDADVRECPSG